MELNYVKSQSTVKPLEIEFCKKSVYLRQNIVSDGELWNYEEACLTPEEFNEYISQVKAANALKSVNDSSNIISIITSQANGDNNQLIIMEAIADLYDLIMSVS